MPVNAIDRKLAVKYSPEIALAICEAIASGKTLSNIVDDDNMPSRQTIYRWLTVYPKFFSAYERAREVAAQSFEDEALDMARKLAGPNDFTGTKVQAFNIAMQQLRWSAARRDPKRYGQTVNNTAGIAIQINTTLNLGQDGKAAVDDNTSGYTIEYTVPATNAETDEDPDEVERITQRAEVVETDDETADNRLTFDLPETETQQLHNPANGRPRKGSRSSPGSTHRKGHKPVSRTKALITKMANKEDK